MNKHTTILIIMTICITLLLSGCHRQIKQEPQWNSIHNIKIVDRTNEYFSNRNGANFIANQFAIEFRSKGYNICNDNTCKPDAIFYITTLSYDERLNARVKLFNAYTQANSRVSIMYKGIRAIDNAIYIDEHTDCEDTIPIEELAVVVVKRLTEEIPIARNN